MSCASCAARINKVLNDQPGVYEANINYATASAQIIFDTDKCSGQSLKVAVQSAGYDMQIDSDSNTNEKVEQAHLKNYRLLKTQNFGSGNIIHTYYGNQHVLCRHALHAIYFVDAFYFCHFRFWAQILRQCLAAIKTRSFQHGHFSCYQYRNSLSIQCIQFMFS